MLLESEESTYVSPTIIFPLFVAVPPFMLYIPIFPTPAAKLKLPLFTTGPAEYIPYVWSLADVKLTLFVISALLSFE